MKKTWWLERQTKIRIRASSEALNVTQPLTKSTSFGKMHLSEIINNLRLNCHNTKKILGIILLEEEMIRVLQAPITHALKNTLFWFLKSRLWKHMFFACDVKWTVTSRNSTIAWFFDCGLSSATFLRSAKIYIFEIVRVRIKVFHCEGMLQLISIRRYMSLKKMYNGLNWLHIFR